MIWASWQGYLNGQGWAFLPRKAFELRDDPEALRQLCHDRIADIGGVFRGKVESIDVLNEPMEHRDLMKVLGEDEIAEWFRRARQADPDATLVLNEAITFEWSAGAQNLVRLARRLDELGAPLDALGIQAHYGVSLTGIDDVYAALNRFAATGKKVQITEFDMPGHDRRLHADYLRDLVTIAFSHPAVTHFVQWGISDASHWRAPEKPGLWDENYRIKPAGEAYRDLVFGSFWTNTEGESDLNGAFEVRGFAGTYKITVVHGDQSREFTVELPVEGATKRVAF
jgi:GH35 family endo-1,4-beta-xylanase